MINNNIDPSSQVWNISMAIFTLYMYSIRKVIMYNCHLDTQPGDLGPFKGCYSVTSTKRSFSPRNKKRLETSKHPLNWGSGIFLFVLIGINRGMIEKVGQNLSLNIKQVRYRRSNSKFHMWFIYTSIRSTQRTFFLVMHDGIVLCLSHLFASLKWRLWSLKWPQSVIKSYTELERSVCDNVTLTLFEGNLTYA